MSDDQSWDKNPQKPYTDDVGAGSGDLVIGTKGRVLAIIKPSGKVVLGEGVLPDEAAAAFWEALGQKRLEMEDRLLIVDHMEAILIRLGAQDLRTEDLRLRALAAEEESPGSNKARELTAAAETSIARLNMIAQEAIELGRGLARRGDPLPEVPEQVPVSIQNDEASNYQGKGGLPKDEEFVFNAPAPPKGKPN